MTVNEFKKLQAEKLKEQKIKPMQKVSNSFIDSTLHKSNPVSYTHLTLPTSDLV